MSVRSLRLSCRRSNTKSRPDVGLLLAYHLWRWANISPVLVYRTVFDATLNVGQRHRWRDNISPALDQTMCRYMLLRKPIIDPLCVGVTCISQMPGHCVWRWPTFKRHWGVVNYVHVLTVSCLLCTATDIGPLSTQRAQSICVAFVQCRANVEDVGPPL